MKSFSSHFTHKKPKTKIKLKKSNDQECKTFKYANNEKKNIFLKMRHHHDHNRIIFFTNEALEGCELISAGTPKMGIPEASI